MPGYLVTGSEVAGMMGDGADGKDPVMPGYTVTGIGLADGITDTGVPPGLINPARYGYLGIGAGGAIGWQGNGD